MIFRKEKRMIDVRELQRRGIVKLPKQNIVIPTNRDGFVEFGSSGKPIVTATTETPSPTPTPTSNTELFGFTDTPSSADAIPSASSPESSGPAGSCLVGALESSTNRAESERITELDNKIYKLEQRIELLEKKLDVNQPTNNPVGVMGW